MPTIDIPLPPELSGPLTPPLCAEFGLDGPPPELPSVTIMGMPLTGIADFTRGIPSNCQLNFSLVVMIAPLMASLACPLKLLKVFGDLINAAKGLPPNPIALLDVLKDAESALSACLGLVTPLGICPFVKTVLLLIISMLNCFLQALTSIIELMEGLTLKISAANAAGNIDAVIELNCAMQNAQNTAAGTLSSLQPIAALLQIASPIFSIANITLDPLPGMPGGGGIDELKQAGQTLQPVLSTLQSVVQALPC